MAAAIMEAREFARQTDEELLDTRYREGDLAARDELMDRFMPFARKLAVRCGQHRQDRRGRSNAWICDFSSTARTTARSGGFKYKPQMSWTFSMNCGSFDSFQVSCRCGCSPNACQIRITASGVIPTSLAIDLVDQCVASFGADSSVVITTRSTCSSVIVRGRPGRGSSNSPSRRRSANRLRHFVTVGRETPNDSAISPFVNNPAAASTIRALKASA